MGMSYIQDDMNVIKLNIHRSFCVWLRVDYIIFVIIELNTSVSSVCDAVQLNSPYFNVNKNHSNQKVQTSVPYIPSPCSPHSICLYRFSLDLDPLMS